MNNNIKMWKKKFTINLLLELIWYVFFVVVDDDEFSRHGTDLNWNV